MAHLAMLNLSFTVAKWAIYFLVPAVRFYAIDISDYSNDDKRKTNHQRTVAGACDKLSEG